jgi:hypothetical protein
MDGGYKDSLKLRGPCARPGAVGHLFKLKIDIIRVHPNTITTQSLPAEPSP